MPATERRRRSLPGKEGTLVRNLSNAQRHQRGPQLEQGEATPTWRPLPVCAEPPAAPPPPDQLLPLGAIQVNSGMMKMYQAEVMSKLPIMQHMLFGRLFAFPEGE